MVRLNLQLFAYTGNSIVDYLESVGQDSSYTARKKIAANLGISNYSGTASQNTQMLNALRSGSTTNKTNTTNNTNKNTNKNTTPTNTSSNVKVNGVDQSLVNTMGSSFSQSNDVTNKYQEADKNYSTYKELASTTDIIDQSTWDALNSSFVSSDAYNQAMQYTNELLDKLNSGKTSYTDQIKDLMSQIQNREDFEYDVEKDTLFQQALASAMGSGKSAMQDTIGQASALTGGYGSTYATSAGNQAYNAYIEDAYNNLPEYYNMALQAYQAEGQEMYQQLDMLNAADATEWGRTYDAWQSNFANAQQMYNQEYGAWQDSVTNAYNSANLQLSEHNQLVTDAYNLYATSKDSADTLYAQEYQKWQDQVTQATQLAGMQQTDYWNQTELDYKKDRDAVADSQWQQTFDFNKTQADIAQSNWEKEYKLELASKNAKIDDTTGNVTVDNTAVDIDNIPKAVNTRASKFETDTELETYLDEQVEAGIITESQADYLYSVNKTPGSNDSSKKWYEQDWTISKDTRNWNNWLSKGNEDYNDKYKVGKDGQEYTYKQLKDKINSEPGLTDAQKKAFLKKLKDQSLK